MSAPTAATSSASSTTISVMLAIHEKKTAAVDLYRPLRQYISLHYSEREAQNLEDDLDFLRLSRSSLEKPPGTDSPTSRRDLLQSYYRALCAVESRFPISPDRNHVNNVSFTWYDAFKPSKRAAQQNIHFEKAAVLFNLGAVHSQIALSADRNNEAGLKQACNSFQAAAGAFAFLRDNASIKASVGSTATVDVSAECAGMLERLMLAQAQECFFEKVNGDGKPPGLCSKVARQVGLYYEEAYAALSTPPLNQHFDRTWISHVQLKAAQFYAEACYRIGLDLHEKEDIALEIARLKAGISALPDAKKSTKGVAAPLLDAVVKLVNNMNRNLERAMKENDRVYLMRIPAQDTLTPLPAASLVKPVDMGVIFDASKERLFASLIPDSSAKALSRYTEMVDDIIRTQAEKLQQGSEITRVKLREMDLPESILALEGNLSLPVDLKESVEDVQVIGGQSGLEAELQQLRDVRRVNQELLVQTEELLHKEEREDSQFQTQFGTRIPRKPSSTMTMNLKDRLNKFAANLKQAADSDGRIERAVRDNSELMAVLDGRPIESALPNLARPIMSLDGNEDAIVGALKQSLGRLETLGAQRAGLEDMLKDMKRKDDILPKLMATTGSSEDLFRKEISKYDHICVEIAQNIEAQEQLLLQIQVQNEDFSAVFNLEDYRVSREKCYKQIAAAVAKFREIKDNINEGLKFYVTLQDAITNVKQQCSDFVVSRNLEFRQAIESVQKKIAGLSFPPDGKAGYNYPSASQPNLSANTTSPVDPQSTPPPPGYNYPSANMYQQVDPRSAQSLGYNYLPAGQPNPPPNMRQQVDHRSTQPPPGYNYPSSGQPNHSTNIPQPVNPLNTASSPNLAPYHQRPPEQPRSGYSQSYAPYGASQQPPYQAPPVGGPYQPPQQQPNHEYGQPAYPGWHGQYYNAPPQQPGSYPRPPYNSPGSYPPRQGGYYKPE